MNAYDRSLHNVPVNIEAEQAVLGVLLLNNDAMDHLSQLEPEHFYEKLHRAIFEVCGKLIRQGKPASPVTVKDFLPADLKVGDMNPGAYLAKLVSEAISMRSDDGAAEAIILAYERRQALSVAQDVSDAVMDLPSDGDVYAELAKIESAITTMRAKRADRAGHVGIGQQYLDGMTQARQRGKVLGVPICLPEIGDVISEPCFEAGNLYGLLSSSGEGKTSLTLQIIAHAVEQGHPVLFLSYDQSAQQCVRQMVSQKFGIEARRQRSGDLAEKEWEKAVGYANWLDKQPFEVIRCQREGVTQLVSHARLFVKKRANGKVPFVVIDHIGKVKPRDPKLSADRISGEVTVELKAFADEASASVLILNQRNSFGTRRDNPRPISADLYGGEGARADYDAVLYLYRPEKYKAEREATAATDSDWKKINKVFTGDLEGVAEIGAIKVRFGSASIRERVRFEDRFTRYKSERPQTDQGGLL